MPQIGKLRCGACGKVFRGSLGDFFDWRVFACERCDRLVHVRREDVPAKLDPNAPDALRPEHVCRRCGGRLRCDLNRKCPACGSRETVMIEVDEYAD